MTEANTGLRSALATVEVALEPLEREAMVRVTALKGNGATRAEWTLAYYHHKDLAVALKVIREMQS